ncbi:hypothetical protein KGO04_04485 [Patescibacteria group bacterium]|nr:hypothetical protein [Patescibacteria group bacterium]MDE1943933.1 hypothetical protein [Patescibacteria group bacterium]MDE1945480.1 hypothetical protein [Patescibacteria group bacterium]
MPILIVPDPNTGYIAGLGGSIIHIINGVLVPVLFAISFIVFLWGIARTYIFAGGEKHEEGHKLILWGIIGFAVMLSIWGIVNVVTNTFGVAAPGPDIPLPKGPYGP